MNEFGVILVIAVAKLGLNKTELIHFLAKPLVNFLLERYYWKTSSAY